MKRLAILTLLAVSALAAALLLAQSSPNRGWEQSLKPGSIITEEEIERLEEEGWRLVEAEQMYKLYGFTAVYGVCNTTLLLAEKPESAGWDPMLRPMLNPQVETLRLSSAANATLYHMPARLYEAPLAYCLEEINETAYRVTGLIKHAYIGEGRGKPYKVIVRVSHERFEKLLQEEWVESYVARLRVSRRLAEESVSDVRILGWARVERRVCSVDVVVEAPRLRVVYGDPAYTYPNSYLRHVIVPLARLMWELRICTPDEAVKASYWIVYNVANERDPYPPNWLVEGGVCWQWAEWTYRALRMLGLPAYLLYTPGNPPHESVLLCREKLVAYRGWCYGLLAARLLPDGRLDRNHTLVCWLFDDTGYVTDLWRQLPKLGARVHLGRQAYPPEIYQVVKTWTGCRIPGDVLNATRAG